MSEEIYRENKAYRKKLTEVAVTGRGQRQEQGVWDQQNWAKGKERAGVQGPWRHQMQIHQAKIMPDCLAGD